jgi:hypothetical protein
MAAQRMGFLADRAVILDGLLFDEECPFGAPRGH